MAQHHLAEEDTNFLTMTHTDEHPVDHIDEDEINEYSDPLVLLMAREEALAKIKAKEMTLRNERLIGTIRRSKV